MAFQIDAPLTLGEQIEARARHPEIADRTLLVQDERSWTYREYRDECVRLSHFLLGRLADKESSATPGHVAILLENHMELLSLLGGCGYAGFTMFGLNAGLRGPTLSGVLNQARIRLLVVDEKFLPHVEAVQGGLEGLREEDILVLPTAGSSMVPRERTLDAQVSASVGAQREGLVPPVREVAPDTNLMVIYTSGTTGLPKGINNSHFKLLAIGRAVSERLELGGEDRGYACMPLFHSNALFLGFMPAFSVGASMAVRRRFSAGSFVADVKRYGVSYWNYVGEPVHYILGAIEQEYGGEEKILAEVAGDPENRLRYAIGNGASPPDIDRFIRWLGMEDMFELYGSTEAAISTFRRKTDPRGSVGEITDPAVKILDPDGCECALAEVGQDGRLVNYADAVGEICRIAEDTSLFQGYFDNPEANQARYRGGVYHSGDLGHVRVVDGKSFLYFDGRTDDWIRKDGENFSAAQVARQVQEHPDVVLAAAYGVPCAVSDELVMVALKLRPGVEFVPDELFRFCTDQVASGGMDSKWFPDFVRIVDDFVYTETQKILVRGLKAEHFDRRRLARDPIFWRQRGSTTFEGFRLEDFEHLRGEFGRAEREELLDR